MMELALRPVSAADEEFLLGVYADSRARELERVPWDEAVKQAFVRMQFAAQQAHYRLLFPEARHDVILADGVPAGRLYVDRRETEIRILDFGLRADVLGRDIESRLLRDLKAEAEAAGKALSVRLDPDDPLRGLLEGTGFARTGGDEIAVEMAWHPAGVRSG